MSKDGFYGVIHKELNFFFSVPALLWLLFFFYVPILFIVGISFIQQGDIAWWNSFSFSHYSSLLKPVFGIIIQRSLKLAFGTACACLVIAYPVAYFVALRIQRFKNLFLFLLIFPFATNLLIHVYAWFFVLEKTGLINSCLSALILIKTPIHLLNTPFAVYLVMIYCYLPFMILPIYTVLEKFDIRLIEASLDLGATRFMTFLRVILPLTLPGISTGFFLVFIPSFGEFVIPALMGGSRYFFVGSLISHYFLIVRDLSTGAAFTCLSSVILLVVTLFFYYFFKWLARTVR